MITSLMTGGAERMLARVVRYGDATRFQHHIVTLIAGGRLVDEVIEAGATVSSLGIDPDGPPVRQLARAIPRLVGTPRADLIVGWLDHGNVLASLMGVTRPRVPVVLNFRHTPSPADFQRPIVRSLRRLARRSALRLANSHSAIEVLEGAGFGRVAFIPNGFSIAEFSRSTAEGSAFRRSHGIPVDAFLFGHVGRAHPMKDQEGLLRAARAVVAADEGVHMAIVGRGITALLGGQLGLGPEAARIHLVEEVPAPQAVYSALDAYVHSSYSEGFPNVIAEAMLEELPVVCTDVGESRAIVGDRNFVVPPRRHDLLADGMREVVRLSTAERAELGASNRARVAAEYSVEAVVRRFEADLAALVSGT